MARIKNLNLLWKRFVSITKGGIPKHLRGKGSIGGVPIGALRLRVSDDFARPLALFIWCFGLTFGSQLHVNYCRKSA